ncbi:MAG TPA: class I SAM-dependent methyltransferase [Thermoanaerobaculia bacterium]|jgi:SAM-dependent methyltransferase
MSLYGERVLPRLIHWALGSRELLDLRRKYLEGTSGAVLEVGFGSGLNLPFYSQDVRQLYAIEPSTGAWELARDAVAAAPFPVERAGETAESIPLPDASVGAAVSTWTLCTIPDAGRALREIRRVLVPGGAFRFIEHGRSDEPRVARWQDRLTPLQKRLAGGCHLNRRIDELIAGAGFRLERLDRFYVRGPKIGTYLYAGRAVKDGGDVGGVGAICPSRPHPLVPSP